MTKNQDLNLEYDNTKPSVNKEIKIRSTFDLVLESFRIYKPIFWKAMALMLAPILLLIMLAVIFIGISLFTKFLLFGIIASIFNLLFTFLILFAIFLGILVSVLSQTSLFLLIKKGQEANIKELFIESKKFAWDFFMVKLNVSIFTFLWSLLFFIPGLIMAVFYSLSLWVFFYDGFTGGQALKKSKELIRGCWWSVFLRYIGIALILLLIIILPTIFSNSLIFDNIWGVIVQIILFILTPFFIIYSQLIFKDLKRIKEQNNVNE